MHKDIDNLIEAFEACPVKRSMRKSTLSADGVGGKLKSLYDSKRFDGSRTEVKSWKNYRRHQTRER